ncbi:MAG: peptide deformylase [Patescibacteria group bacterium]
MTVRTVLHHPDPKLRERSREVDVTEITSTNFQTLLEDMIDTMKVENGVGLAAPQIGVQKRVIIIETPQGPMPFINPVIVKKSKRLVNSEEGCLSVPEVYGIVKRHKQVKVTALDRTGLEIEIKTGGLISTIFQHEIDHIDGILFIDKAEKIQQIAPGKEETII